jgi:hypothetical protein
MACRSERGKSCRRDHDARTANRISQRFYTKRSGVAGTVAVLRGSIRILA